MSCNKFWLDNPSDLFCDHRIIPTQYMTFEKQMNSITRLVIIVGIVLYLLGYKQSLLFILISLLMIILGYYIKTSKMSTKENYDSISTLIGASSPVGAGKFGGSQFYSGYATNIQTNQNFVSQNQALVGPPNPKTLIKPIVVDPIYDITQRASELNVPTAINKRSAQFLGDSGYYVRDSNVFPDPVERNRESVEYYSNPSRDNRRDPREPIEYSNPSRDPSESIEYYVNPVANTSRASSATSRLNTMPNDSYDYRTFGEPGVDVNTAAVYNPSHYTKYNAPNNVPISECDMKDPDFNERIYTQYIQPNSYNKTQVVGFPSSNIGISFQEPLYKTSIVKNKDGGNTFTELDPNDLNDTSIPYQDPYSDEPSYSEMYDPRQNGYGSQKRSYLDPMTGQPRYFYKDVDAVRRGNFFTRNNIDHLPFSQQTGLMKDYVNTDVYCAADGAYLDQNSQFRENIQQSLLSKRNQEMWQLRKYPISRSGHRNKNLR